MYVQPSTSITFLSNVPLDNTYEHTLLFYDRPNTYNIMITGKEWQRYYFTQKQSRTGLTLTGQSYQDPTDNILRVEANYKQLYNKNYMFFDDSKHNPTSTIITNPLSVSPRYESVPKRYYCFVKRVSYVNENVSEVEFEVDVMQTYMFDYTLKECFIDREHSATDNFYENTVPENLEIGDEYICYFHGSVNLNPNVQPDTLYHSMKVCILANSRTSGSSPSVVAGDVKNGVFCGCNAITGIYCTDYLGMTDAINRYLPEEIIAIYQYPNIMETSGDGRSAGYSGYTSFPRFGKEFGETGDYQTHNYTAKNAKMACYPYTKLLVSDNAGNVAEYKYEYFLNEDRGEVTQNFDMVNNVYFWIRGVAVTQAAVALIPYMYKQVEHNYDEAIVMSNFPECSWPGDSFKSWWAQNKNQFQAALTTNQLGYVANGISALGQAASGNAVGAFTVGARSLISASTNIMQQMAKMQDIKNIPNATRGVAQTSTLNAAMGRYRFDIYAMKIKPEYAKLVDRYFSRFGYKCNKIKVPNTNVRKYWCFTKTIGCAITEQIGNDIARKICSIYDNGITFWRYWDTRYNLEYIGGQGFYDLEPNVGEYSHYDWDNTPLADL